MRLIKLLMEESKLRVVVIVLSGLVSAAAMTLLMNTIQANLVPDRTDSVLPYYILAAVLFVGANVGGNLPLLSLTENIVFKLRLRIIRGILAARFRHLEEVGEHRLYAALTNDVGAVSHGLAIIPGAMINAAMFFGCLTYMVMVSWQILVALVVLIGALIFLFRFANRIAADKFTLVRESGDSLFEHFKTITGGVKELKMHGRRRRAFIDQEVVPASETYRVNQVKGLSSLQVANAAMGLGFFAVGGFIVFVVPRLFDISYHQLGGAVMTFMFMYTPLTKMFELVGAIANANVSLKKLDALTISLEDNHADEAAPEEPGDRAWRALSLEGVVHTYFNERKDESFSLGPMSLSFHPGEIVFITGGNGSGKSTLAKLITALYEPEAGRVVLDGTPITEANREWYRNHFSTVFSDFFLFSRFLGIEDPHLKNNAARYLEMLHLDHKVTVDADGVSTTSLSTGQRKRLALLLAYLEDRPIYLFDEWASDQDPQFKKVFYEELLPELKRRNKAVIVISHDDRYFHTADRLYKLADGRLEAEVAAPAGEVVS